MNANTTRAERGRQAIQLHPDLRPDGIDFQTAAVDMIADVLHAVRTFGDPSSHVDARDLLDQARRIFETHRDDDELPAPTLAKRTYRAEELDQLASLARTALDDPAGLPDDIPTWAWATAGGWKRYAIEQLDAIIRTLNPAENTPETMAAALRTLGRHMAEILDRLDAGPAAWHFDEAAAAVDRGLDDVDEAIRTLEGGDDQ